MRALITLALLVACAGAWAQAVIMQPAALPELGTLGLLAAGALATFKLRRKK